MNNDDMIGLKKQIPDAILNRIPRGSLLTLKGKKELIGVEIGVQ